MKKLLVSVLTLWIILTSIVGCTQKTEAPVETPAPVAKGSIILSTTTSTQDSGLLDYLLPIFTEDTGIEVKTVAVGTGKALQMGRDGDADVLLVHAKTDELTFVEEGHGTVREDVMYNDFIIVGPKFDPLKSSWQIEPGNDIKAALSKIYENKMTFVSRGDDSGTHKKELAIWKSASIEPSGDWYLSAGSGMGEVLKITHEKQGYTITDRATYLSQRDNLDLDILIEGDDNLFNQYGVIPVNPDKNAQINYEGAIEFMNWLITDKGQNLIKTFGVEKYGQPLFIPNFK